VLAHLAPQRAAELPAIMRYIGARIEDGDCERLVKELTQYATLSYDEFIEFLSRFVDPRSSPICGNSICQDRRFLFRHMPKLEAFFHYRNLDVSTVKELARRWYPDLLKRFTKRSSHLAMDDIKDSIEELRYYRQYFFRMPGFEVE
ncbi:MAG: oligoribonuclease, partial [Perlucidibaca sp.]